MCMQKWLITTPTVLVAIMVGRGITDPKQVVVLCMEQTPHRLKNQNQISFKEELRNQDGLHLEVDLEDDQEALVMGNNLALSYNE